MPDDRAPVPAPSHRVQGGVIGHRPRGRPPVQEPRQSVSAWLPASLHDQLIDLAKREERSISGMIKTLLILRLK